MVWVKCPLCVQESSLDEAADGVRSFCLDKLGGGKLQLKHSHPYYYQCQLQISVTKRGYCHFAVWTKEELHIERITLDRDLIKESLPAAQKFFKLSVLP